MGLGVGVGRAAVLLLGANEHSDSYSWTLVWCLVLNFEMVSAWVCPIYRMAATIDAQVLHLIALQAILVHIPVALLR